MTMVTLCPESGRRASDYGVRVQEMEVRDGLHSLTPRRPHRSQIGASGEANVRCAPIADSRMRECGHVGVRVRQWENAILVVTLGWLLGESAYCCGAGSAVQVAAGQAAAGRLRRGQATAEAAVKQCGRAVGPNGGVVEDGRRVVLRETRHFVAQARFYCWWRRTGSRCAT